MTVSLMWKGSSVTIKCISTLDIKTASYFLESDVKKKWKNLRTTFQREHKTASCKTSGSGADEVHYSKWRHYSQMLFLLECGESDTSEDNIQPPVTSPTPSLAAPKSPPCLDDDDDERRGTKRAKKNSDMATAEEAMAVALKHLKRVEKGMSKHDGFLKYLEELLNDVSEEKIKALKRKLLELAHSYSEE